MSNCNSLIAIPFLGSGLGYRRQIAKQIRDHEHDIDFLEIITDQFTDDPVKLSQLEELCDHFKVIPHGIDLSIGSAVPLDSKYLSSIKTVSDLTRAPYYSEHLCMTRAPGIEIGHLSPLWFTEQVLQNTIRNVSEVQNYLGKPLVLENVTYLFEVPGATMSQTEFFHRLVQSTDCGILLDLTNIHINSVNHHFAPVAFLRNMPLVNVVQVHLAGGFWNDNVLVDGHSECVHEETWDLFSLLASLTEVKGSILEHDANFPQDFSPLLEVLNRARGILDSSRTGNRSLLSGENQHSAVG